MKQFILEQEPDRQGRVRIEGSGYRYLVRVRRLAPGEYFPALLPSSAKVAVRIVSIESNILTGEIAPAVPGETQNPSFHAPALPPIYLYQALPKSDKMDLIVRQAAEGAIAGIAPFVSEFSSAQPLLSNSQKFLRWQKIVKEARQQCGSAIATEVFQPAAIDALFARWEQLKSQKQGVIGLLFHHIPLANDSIHGYLGTWLKGRHEAAVIAIGPEGGFSPAEAERFIAAGFRPFTIGDTILRTETAALYAAAAVRVILLEKDSWETK